MDEEEEEEQGGRTLGGRMGVWQEGRGEEIKGGMRELRTR